MAMNQTAKWLERTGLIFDDHYNHSPIKDHLVREITKAQFVKEHGHEGMDSQDYRQIEPEYIQPLNPEELNHYKRPMWKSYLSLHFWWCHGNLYGMSFHYWEEDVRYWKIGCDHKMDSGKNIGNCLNTYTCEKCGYKVTYDSSD